MGNGHKWSVIYFATTLKIYSLFKPDEICLNGKTALYNMDCLKKRIEQLKSIGIVPLPVWECTVLDQLEKDAEMANFFASLPNVGPLYPRDAFQVYF